MISSRKMKLLLAVTLFLTVSCLLPQQSRAHVVPVDDDDECDRWVDTAIFGAGAAGSYAAYKLRNTNMTIEVFDYLHRIGGRLYSCDIDNATDAIIEYGIMKYVERPDSRIERLAKELGLTPVDFLEGRAEKKKYFLRGKLMTLEQIQSGEVPFNLTAKEKENQARLAEYYLSELTGFNQSTLTDEQAIKLTLSNGRPLYKLRLSEALDMVASADGKELLRALGEYDGHWAESASATAFFHAVLGVNSQGKDRTLKEGMSKLPQRLIEAFLKANAKHNITLHRKLESILRNEDGDYQLKLVKTIRKSSSIMETNEEETVCAKKVILAIPQRALSEVGWEVLKSGKVREAIEAVIPVKSSKVYMTFPETTQKKPFWLNAEESNSTFALKSDTPISQMIDWKYSSILKQYVLLASYADMNKTAFLESLNSEGALHPASVQGHHKASNPLVYETLSHLSEALDVPKKDIKSPLKVLTKFWNRYPFGGLWYILNAGFNPEDVKQTIQQPSFNDEVYIVGSDLGSFQSNTGGVEDALATVDEVYEKYRIQS